MTSEQIYEVDSSTQYRIFTLILTKMQCQDSTHSEQMNIFAVCGKSEGEQFSGKKGGKYSCGRLRGAFHKAFFFRTAWKQTYRKNIWSTELGTDAI